MDAQTVIDQTRRWISSMVIGLNLCPFARRVFEADTIRYVVSAAEDSQSLLDELGRELTSLAASPISSVETTLLIYPHVLGDFLDYNDFLDVAEQRIADLDLEGVIQIASFHPRYQFADTKADDVENFTNRSPYPMLHLLREDSITAIADDADELLAIPERNIATLRNLGRERIEALIKTIASEGQR